jgi:hypothetical protein
MAAIPVAYAVRRAWPGRSRIEELGVSSLFVYWIHVEMVYGLLSLPIHRRLPLELSLLGAAALAVGLFWLVKLKNRLQGGRPKMNNERSSTAGTVNPSLVHGRG